MKKIKILWIINIVLPEALQLLNNANELMSSGGWLLGAANSLSNHPDINLVIACPSSLVKELCFLQGSQIGYYVFPMGKGNTHKNPEYRKYWRIISDEYKPDVVHIHGTEFTHGYEFLKECGADNVVVSIQGVVSAIADYYNLGLSLMDIVKNITFRDILKGTLFHDRNVFRRKGCCEVELLQLVNHVIGRTKWDRAHVWAINPNAQYHFCNETLRPEFYNAETWAYKNCIPHTIFLSQATYPVKGLHMVLKAMPLVLRQYPDAQIRVAGMDVTRRKEGINGWLKLSGYGKIIKSLIKKFQLDDKICFLGNLDAEEMIKEYLRTNVFICPSSIENSPNSLGEAQILGTPVIASYVGGIPDMMVGDERHLYRFEEFEMLASIVCDVFSKEDAQINMKEVAKRRHDRYKNLDSTMSIYKSIIIG